MYAAGPASGFLFLRSHDRVVGVALFTQQVRLVGFCCLFSVRSHCRGAGALSFGNPASGFFGWRSHDRGVGLVVHSAGSARGFLSSLFAFGFFTYSFLFLLCYIGYGFLGGPIAAVQALCPAAALRVVDYLSIRILFFLSA